MSTTKFERRAGSTVECESPRPLRFRRRLRKAKSGPVPERLPRKGGDTALDFPIENAGRDCIRNLTGAVWANRRDATLGGCGPRRTSRRTGGTGVHPSGRSLRPEHSPEHCDHTRPDDPFNLVDLGLIDIASRTTTATSGPTIRTLRVDKVSTGECERGAAYSGSIAVGIASARAPAFQASTRTLPVIAAHDSRDALRGSIHPATRSDVVVPGLGYRSRGHGAVPVFAINMPPWRVLHRARPASMDRRERLARFPDPRQLGDTSARSEMRFAVRGSQVPSISGVATVLGRRVRTAASNSSFIH